MKKGFTPLEVLAAKIKLIFACQPKFTNTACSTAGCRQKSIQRTKLLTGFTLVEIMVTFVLIGLLTVVAFANYRAGEKQFALKRSAHKLTQDLRSAQGLAVASKEFKGIFQGGYGIYFTLTQPSEEKGSYILFVDCDADNQYDGDQMACNDCSTGSCTASSSEKVETISLENGVLVSQFVPVGASLTVKFYPPDPTVTFNPDSNSVSIVLSVSGLPVKTITLNKAGLIEIE